ncbi:hypothetical protein AURDEDRAFT_160666 [Auricularia subglabra TFB-10046 SS5]|nr:hypothetical protein AURDEDRAFT_160666 [Auricularia subglabra TFB-10046 SS5]
MLVLGFADTIPGHGCTAQRPAMPPSPTCPAAIRASPQVLQVLLLRVHTLGAGFAFPALILALVAIFVFLALARYRPPRLPDDTEVGIQHVFESRSEVTTYGTMHKPSPVPIRTASPTLAPSHPSTLPVLILAVQSKSPPATYDYMLSSNPCGSRGLVLKVHSARALPLMHRENGALRYGEKYRTIGRSFRLELAPIPEERPLQRKRAHTTQSAPALARQLSVRPDLRFPNTLYTSQT